jgi:tRNA threonylcarbamoyladenosine biosynthesis protein TsaB
VVVLGLDTATANAVVGVTRREEVLHEAALGPDPDGRPRHSRMLLAEVERCAEGAGGWERVDRIAVGIGPGSYTGLRIGIATGRALAQARRLPLAAVGSLAALARGMADHAQADERPLLPAIDARRGQMFAALYEPEGDQLWEPLVADPGELAERLGGLERSPLAAGDGAVRFRAEFEAAGVTVAAPEDPVHRIAARNVCALGEAAAAVSPDRIEPIYLRAPDAKRWIERDRRRPDD